MVMMAGTLTVSVAVPRCDSEGRQRAAPSAVTDPRWVR